MTKIEKELETALRLHGEKTLAGEDSNPGEIVALAVKVVREARKRSGILYDIAGILKDMDAGDAEDKDELPGILVKKSKELVVMEDKT